MPGGPQAAVAPEGGPWGACASHDFAGGPGHLGRKGAPYLGYHDSNGPVAVGTALPTVGRLEGARVCRWRRGWIRSSLQTVCMAMAVRLWA